jgi:serine/threonine-protein kinase HipA
VATERLHAPERSLLATIDGQTVGTLQEYRNLWRFEYTPAWRGTPDGFDLSPWLPRRDGRIVDGSTSRPVQWYFDNLLPEEHLRVRIAAEANIAGNDDFALLAHDGAESAGSLTLLPPGKMLAPGTRVPLSDAELSRRIGRLPRFSLSSGAEKRMSLAGAQH